MVLKKEKILEWTTVTGETYIVYRNVKGNHVEVKCKNGSVNKVDLISFKHLINIILDSEVNKVLFVDSRIKGDIVTKLGSTAIFFNNLRYALIYSKFYNKGKSKRKLFDLEDIALSKIAELSGMNCWFTTLLGSDGYMYVYDLENGERLALSTGIKQLAEGITNIKDYGLPHNIEVCLIRVFDRMGVDVERLIR